MAAYENQTSTGLYDYMFVELAGMFRHWKCCGCAINLFLDPRTNDWFLVKDPLPLLTLLILYLYFVRSWGPSLMKNRKPFELKHTLVIYNFLQVLISTFLVYEVSLMKLLWSLVSLFVAVTHVGLVVYVQLEMRTGGFFIFRTRFKSTSTNNHTFPQYNDVYIF